MLRTDNGHVKAIRHLPDALSADGAYRKGDAGLAFRAANSRTVDWTSAALRPLALTVRGKGSTLAQGAATAHDEPAIEGTAPTGAFAIPAGDYVGNALPAPVVADRHR